MAHHHDGPWRNGLEAQAGLINLYDRKTMVFYDIYTHWRADQLPLVPYLSRRLEAG